MIIPTAAQIDEDMCKIKYLIHGSQRREYRRRINRNIRVREDLRKDRKWRKVLSSVLGIKAGRKHQEGVDLNMLEKDGEVIGDPLSAHSAITDNFEKDWFAKPEWCQGALHDLKDKWSWRTSMRSKEFFLHDTEYTEVPEELRSLIFKAIQETPRPAILIGCS